MVELFDISKKTVSEHIGNVFREGELDKAAVVRDFQTTAADGKACRTNYYNLDVIISVGYRVKSKRGTSFRQWATQVLRQYLVQGYALNEKRLRESQRQLADLKRLVQLQAEVAASQELTAELFGREKDKSFESSVRTIYQSFGGQDIYPSVEKKAANLLYFVVKNHSFSNGNKRIVA